MMKPSSSRRRPRQKPSLRSWQLARIAQPVNEGEPPLPDSARGRTGTSTRHLRAKFAPGGGRLFLAFRLQTHMSRNSIILVAMVVAVGIAVATVPAFIRARTTPAMNACINNLRCIDGATQTWALENHRSSNDIPTWEAVRPYLPSGRAVPTCPHGGKYTLGTLVKPPSCSYPGDALPSEL